MKIESKGVRQALVDFHLDPGNIVLTESQEDGVSRVIEGVASRGNVTNLNGRYYPTPVLESACEKLQESVANGSFLGELDHPEFNARGSLERAALKFTRLWMEGDDLRYEAQVLRTEHGNKLLALLQDDVRVGMSTRGVGSVKWEKINPADDAGEVAVVQSDFVLYGVDAVNVPSNSAGIAKLRESLEESMGIEPERKELDMNDVTELRAEYPELVAQVEAAAVEPLQAQVTAFEEKVEELESQLAEAQEVVAKYEELRRSVLGESVENVEASDNDDAVAIAVSALQETVESLRAELEESKAEAERTAARAKLNAELSEKFEETVTGHKFENTLRRTIADLSQFESVEALTTKLEDTIELAESIAGDVTETRPKGKGKVESSDPGKDVKTEFDSPIDQLLEQNSDYIRGLSRENIQG